MSEGSPPMSAELHSPPETPVRPLPVKLPPLLGPSSHQANGKPVRRQPGRNYNFLYWLAGLGPLIGGLTWVTLAWVVPQRKTADVITATATRGELVITVTDRGELESAKSTNVICEVEGGAKIATIVDEGKRVKKGE